MFATPFPAAILLPRDIFPVRHVQRKHEEAFDAPAQFHAEMIGERQSAPDALRRLARGLVIAFSFL